MRLFVAIALPEDVRASLVMLCTGVPGARWIKPENLHLTLRFIGEADGALGNDLVSALALIQSEPLTIQLDGVGQFGDRRGVKVLWAGVAGNPALDSLQGRVERAVQDCGLAPERRKFHPHVTLTRLKGLRSDRAGQYLGTHGQFMTREFAAEAFVLFESRLGHSGPRYLAAADFPLAARGD